MLGNLFGESDVIFALQIILVSRHHEHAHLWPFFTIQSQEVEQTTTMVFHLESFMM